jgi:hypothetical protein
VKNRRCEEEGIPRRFEVVGDMIDTLSCESVLKGEGRGQRRER